MSFFPSVFDDTTTREWVIRALYEDPVGNVFRYVLAEDAAIAANDCVSYATDYGSSTAGAAGEVTNAATSAIDGTLDTINICAGVAAMAIADGSYGYIQVTGLRNVAATGDATDTIVAGDSLVMRGGNDPDGTCVTAVAQEEHAVFGMALTQEAGEVVLAQLRRIL